MENIIDQISFKIHKMYIANYHVILRRSKLENTLLRQYIYEFNYYTCVTNYNKIISMGKYNQNIYEKYIIRIHVELSLNQYRFVTLFM